MAKTLTFEYEGARYTLEFTRKSVEQMERQGFRIQNVIDAPASTLPQLFAGAFLAHHKFVKPEKIDQIFRMMGDREELIRKLCIMYNEPIEALLDEPEEGKNVSWETDW